MSVSVLPTGALPVPFPRVRVISQLLTLRGEDPSPHWSSSPVFPCHPRPRVEDQAQPQGVTPRQVRTYRGPTRPPSPRPPRPSLVPGCRGLTVNDGREDKPLLRRELKTDLRPVRTVCVGRDPGAVVEGESSPPYWRLFPAGSRSWARAPGCRGAPGSHGHSGTVRPP